MKVREIVALIEADTARVIRLFRKFELPTMVIISQGEGTMNIEMPD